MKKWTAESLVEAGYKIENVRIEDVDVSMADYDVLTLEIRLSGNGWGCVFGGYVMGRSNVNGEKGNYIGYGSGAESMMWIMSAVGTSRFNEMKGKYIRVAVKGFSSPVTIIGNIIKDQWFDIESFYSDKKD